MTPSSPEQPCELGIERNPRGGVQVSHLLSLAPIPGPGRDAGFASAHALGLAQGPGKDEGEERGLGKGAEGEEGERRRQHPRGGAASPTHRRNTLEHYQASTPDIVPELHTQLGWI